MEVQQIAHHRLLGPDGMVAISLARDTQLERSGTRSANEARAVPRGPALIQKIAPAPAPW